MHDDKESRSSSPVAPPMERTTPVEEINNSVVVGSLISVQDINWLKSSSSSFKSNNCDDGDDDDRILNEPPALEKEINNIEQEPNDNRVEPKTTTATEEVKIMQEHLDPQQHMELEESVVEISVDPTRMTFDPAELVEVTNNSKKDVVVDEDDEATDQQKPAGSTSEHDLVGLTLTPVDPNPTILLDPAPKDVTNNSRKGVKDDGITVIEPIQDDENKKAAVHLQQQEKILKDKLSSSQDTIVLDKVIQPSKKVTPTVEVKTKVPSVTLVFESKLQEVENTINKAIHKARNGDTSPSGVIKSELTEKVRTLKRADLEFLITDKIIEAIAVHSNVGALNQKLIQSNTQRDRLFLKVSTLQRQVSDLQKAVRSVSENVGRNQKAVNKANPPIRFSRSVGVQVVLKGTLSEVRKSLPSQGEAAKSILKSGNNNAQQLPNGTTAVQVLAPQTSKSLGTSTTTTPMAAPVVSNVNPNLKRPLRPTITVAGVPKLTELQNQNQQAQNKIRRVSFSPTTTVVSADSTNGGIKITPVTAAPPIRQPHILHQMRNPVAAAVSKALNLNDIPPKPLELGTVGPKDNNSPSNRAATTVIPVNNGNLLVNGNPNVVYATAPNGLQQFLISPGPNLQFIQNGKSYQIVTSTSQTRPVFVQPATGLQNVRPGQIRPVTSSPNQLLIRSVIPQTTTSMAPLNLNGGQIVVRPMTAVRPSTNNIGTPMMTKQSFNIVTTRPNITVSNAMAMTSNNKVTFTNVVANRLAAPQKLQTLVQQIPTEIAIPVVQAVVKKFVLPPLPPPFITGNPRRCSKDIPPRPELTLMEQNEGIMLSWTLKLGTNHAEIQTYQIYACQEPLFNSQKSVSWKRVGDVKALPLPMACTLSLFTDENRYYFIVRGVDVYNRTGAFCEVSAITLKKKTYTTAVKSTA